MIELEIERSKAAMAEHDLTAKLAKSMDRHLVFPLLEWLSAKELYPEDQIQQGKLDLLNKTNMLDYAMEIYTQLNNRDPPQELKERRTEVVQNLRKLQVQLLHVVAYTTLTICTHTDLFITHTGSSRQYCPIPE